MLTKRQKNEQYLSMFSFFFGLLVLMTLFIPSLKAGNYTYMGLDIVFGDTIYRADTSVSLAFSWFNFSVYFLPIFGGICLVFIDRFMYHESKAKLWVSLLPGLLFFVSFLMLFFIPSTMNIMVGDVLVNEEISFYVGPFFAIGFILAGLVTSLMYIVQEGKIHQII